MMFKAILCLAFIANAVVAMPSHSRRHHDLAVRMASPNSFEPIAVVQKRSNSGRCKPRSSSSSSSATPTTTSATASKVVGNVGSAPPTTSAHTSSQAPPPPPPSSSPAPTTKASSTTQSQPTQSSGGGSGSESGTFSGDGTYYDTGLTSCGGTFTDQDFIVAVSHILYDSFPGYNGVNPNDNPVCGKKITAHYNGNSVTVTVQDRCTGCAEHDLDFTPAAIAVLAPDYLTVGRIHDVEWSFDD